MFGGLWYFKSSLFQNASVSNEGWLTNFALKFIVMATSLEESGKKVQINHQRTSLVKKS